MPDILSNEFSEPGFLKRLRNWRDAMPWLVLAQCLQSATSVVALILALAALFLGSWGAFALERTIENRDYKAFPDCAALPVRVPLTGSPNLLPAELSQVRGPSVIGVQMYLTSPIRQLAVEQRDPLVFGLRLLQQFWLFAVWILPAGFVMRAAALNVAGRERMSTPDALKLVLKRFPSFLSGVALTLGFMLLCLTYFLLLGFVDRIPAVGTILATAGGLLGLPILFIAGILLFGSLLAFPLMWSSVVVEPYADGFDAASRGFEYIIQRPFRFAAYVVMVWLLSIVIANLLSGIFSCGLALASSAFGLTAAADSHLPFAVQTIAQHVPTAIAFNLFWAFSVGIYLLLRRDANHQDIEEVWEPPQPPAKPLPDLDLPENPA
ncbi:hypothetical protein [Rosistilla oblonga]|uniref:hypothetical protein n=1 Tax=Rosistilla oblonga TaxID=2527990 RepID=UPI003A97327C